MNASGQIPARDQGSSSERRTQWAAAQSWIQGYRGTLRENRRALRTPRGLGCSDSRVSPELVFDGGLGDLFVVRSAGEDDDPISIGSLEYAVEHLGSTVIVVMGHQRCGAVTAACSEGKGESVNLEAMIAPILPSCSKTDRAKPQEFDLAIRDHIHRVAQDILANSELLRKSSAEGKLTVIEAYYSLDTGEVIRLR